MVDYTSYATHSSETGYWKGYYFWDNVLTKIARQTTGANSFSAVLFSNAVHDSTTVRQQGAANLMSSFTSTYIASFQAFQSASFARSQATFTGLDEALNAYRSFSNSLRQTPVVVLIGGPAFMGDMTAARNTLADLYGRGMLKLVQVRFAQVPETTEFTRVTGNDAALSTVMTTDWFASFSDSSVQTVVGLIQRAMSSGTPSPVPAPVPVPVPVPAPVPVPSPSPSPSGRYSLTEWDMVHGSRT